MNKRKVINSIKKLNEAVRHQQGVMSPDSNGKGHGRLLRMIEEHPGISGVELSLMMAVSAPVISEKLSNLEKEGMVYRERDQRDKRKTQVYLTNDGIMALARRDFGQKWFEECIHDCLSEKECDSFIDMCERIIHNIEDMAARDAKWDEAVISFYELQKKQRTQNRIVENADRIAGNGSENNL